MTGCLHASPRYTLIREEPRNGVRRLAEKNRLSLLFRLGEREGGRVKVIIRPYKREDHGSPLPLNVEALQRAVPPCLQKARALP